jgi:hypothetical protein
VKVPPRLRLLSQNNPEKQIWLRPETRFCFPATSLNATRRSPICPRTSTGQQNRFHPETLLCFPAALLNATRHLPLCPRASTGQQNKSRSETRLCQTAALLNAARHLPLCPRASTGQQNKSRPETRLCQTAASLNTTTSLRPILAPKPPSQDGETPPVPNLAGRQLCSTTDSRCRFAGKTSRFCKPFVFPPCPFYAESLCLT